MRFGWRDPDARADSVALRSVLRWTLAAVAVAGLHAGGIWLALKRDAAAAAGEPPAAVMMELAPLAVAPEAPPDQLPPDERKTEVQPSPMEEKNDKPVERPEEKPEPVVEAVKKPVEDVLLPPKPLEIETPKLPEVANAEAVLTPPSPQPKAVRKPPPKKKAERRKPEDRTVDRTTAPLATSNPRADRAAAPSSSSAFNPSTSPATWKSSVNAHLNRHKGGNPNGAMGTVVVAFTINRSGGVVGAHLVRSSGDPVLDAKAVSTPRSASPVPAPPPDVAGSTIMLTVPIRYNR